MNWVLQALLIFTALSASCSFSARCSDRFYGGRTRNHFRLLLRPAVFDCYVVALDIAESLQALTECSDHGPVSIGRRGVNLSHPTTGIADCCARAVSGHITEPPRSVMNSRRFS